MLAADVMTRDVDVISPDVSVREAARRMDEMNVGALPVCDGQRLVGIITDRDIAVRSTAAGEPPDRIRVETIMTQDLRWCFDDTPIERAARIMSEVQIRRLPVVNHDGKLVGMLSLGDLATDRAPGADEALRRISEPSRPDRSGHLLRPMRSRMSAVVLARATTARNLLHHQQPRAKRQSNSSVPTRHARRAFQPLCLPRQRQWHHLRARAR